jgi:hypothetical protein
MLDRSSGHVCGTNSKSKTSAQFLEAGHDAFLSLGRSLSGNIVGLCSPWSCPPPFPSVLVLRGEGLLACSAESLIADIQNADI